MAVVAVNADQSEDWNGASGREFIEQRERHQRMLGRLTARLLAATELLAGLGPAQAAELTGRVRDRLAAYATPDGVVMPGAAWLVTAQAV